MLSNPGAKRSSHETWHRTFRAREYEQWIRGGSSRNCVMVPRNVVDQNAESVFNLFFGIPWLAYRRNLSQRPCHPGHEAGEWEKEEDKKVCKPKSRLHARTAEKKSFSTNERATVCRMLCVSTVQHLTGPKHKVKGPITCTRKNRAVWQEGAVLEYIGIDMSYFEYRERKERSKEPNKSWAVFFSPSFRV